MLVLTRKRDEDIVIKTPEGRTITVTVVRLFSDTVRLGFKADSSVVISRAELLPQEQQDNGLERQITRGPLRPT